MDRAKLERFGKIVRKRRLGLGMTQDQITLAGGPSDKRQTKIEHGAPPAASLTTLAKLDQALRWESGSAAAALNGGWPTPLEGRALTPDDIDRRVALALALERAGIAKTAADGAPRGENGALADDVIDSLIDLLNSLPPGERS